MLRNVCAQLTSWAAGKLLRLVGALPPPARRAFASEGKWVAKARERPPPRLQAEAAV